jgi:hypothetical protein
MARTRRAVAVAAIVFAALAGAGTGDAQGLRTLHVDAFTMRADAAAIDVGATFHLVIQVRVRERVPALDELVIPDVGTMHVLGDERHVTAGPHGTVVVETLTLEPVDLGPFTFAPAHLDAIDGATKKPSRFSTNPVRVVVGTAGSLYPAPGMLWRALLTVVAVAVAAVVALAAAVLLAVAWTRREGRTVKTQPAVVVAPVPAPPPAPRDVVADALRAYRTVPADGALGRLRAALFAAAGVSPGATLRDALAATTDRSLRLALGAAERAAFGPAALRDEASRDLIAATEAWLR